MIQLTSWAARPRKGREMGRAGKKVAGGVFSRWSPGRKTNLALLEKKGGMSNDRRGGRKTKAGKNGNARRPNVTRISRPQSGKGLMVEVREKAKKGGVSQERGKLRKRCRARNNGR